MSAQPLRNRAIFFIFALLAGCTASTASRAPQSHSGTVSASAKRPASQSSSAVATHNARVYPPYVSETVSDGLKIPTSDGVRIPTR